MYDDHVPVIADAMRRDPRVFQRGLIFVVCSIQQQFPGIPGQLARVMEGDLDPLWGHKREAYEYVMDQGLGLHTRLMRATNNAERLALICEVPGIGCVKAGFTLQLMGYDVACLDTRNIKREKRNPRAFRTDGNGRKVGKAWHAKLARYLTETEGKARYYWDTWCNEVAEFYGRTAEDISALHLAIVPDDYIPF